MMLSGCRPAAGVVYQNSTIDALLDGNYDGEMTIAEVGRHGDWGLGTLQSLDGEMIVVNGTFWQIRADGAVNRVAPDALTPFAAVADVGSVPSIPLQAMENYQALQKRLDALRPNDGHAYAIVIEGTFEQIRTRSVPAQDRPYPPLSAAAADQRLFDLRDVRGTLVGFWFPQSMQHVNVPGYHFHFITDDRSGGGHVLEVSTKQVTARVREISEVRIALPRTPPSTRPSAPTASELNRVER
jgi:acetolactate decarboxylase